ncbi:putative transcription factor interactor and regulator CCHC(Zn) family [Helianthus annuus]|nr:putative transcription factor interactor and regulator CCHC(Zn) family [Helianthus annuus]
MNQGSRQFAWASTQNTVYCHCNRCGIGHIPSQCPNHTGPSRGSPQANYAHSEADSYTTWNLDTGANSHGTPDLASMDNSDIYTIRLPSFRPVSKVAFTAFRAPSTSHLCLICVSGLGYFYHLYSKLI